MCRQPEFAMTATSQIHLCSVVLHKRPFRDRNSIFSPRIKKKACLQESVVSVNVKSEKVSVAIKRVFHFTAQFSLKKIFKRQIYWNFPHCLSSWEVRKIWRRQPFLIQKCDIWLLRLPMCYHLPYLSCHGSAQWNLKNIYAYIIIIDYWAWTLICLHCF